MSTATTPPDHYAAANRSGTGRLWRWLTALAIVGNIALNYYSNTHPFAGQTMGMVSAKYPTLLTPAGYAFSIWGLIFLALTIYAVWQLLPAQRRISLPDALAKPLTLASLATGAWVVLFANEMILPSVGVMLLILGCLVVAYGRARRRIFADAAPALAGVPLSLYLGWISVASVINITIGLRQLGWQTAEGASVTLTLGLIFVVVALGLIMSRVFRDMVFPLVVAWALVAVWVVRLREVPELGWAALIGATVVAIAGVVLSRLGGRKTPWQVRDEAAAAAEAEIAARNAMRATE
ncbi:cbb3-type cytochrome oxidase subunit 3 [Hymenobacter sp. UYAg731]